MDDYEDVINMALRPFNPNIDKPKDVGKGGPSTEYSITERMPDGSFANIPSIWWDSQSNPHMLETDQAIQQAVEYERVMGQQFPRYEAPGTAVEHAIHRSANGGATKRPLAEYKGN